MPRLTSLRQAVGVWYFLAASSLTITAASNSGDLIQQEEAPAKRDQKPSNKFGFAGSFVERRRREGTERTEVHRQRAQKYTNPDAVRMHRTPGMDEIALKWNRYSCFRHILREGLKGYAAERHFWLFFKYEPFLLSKT